MTHSHDPAHEELIRELFLGERDASDPEVAQRLAACAACRQLQQGLLRTVERLEAAGVEERDVLASYGEHARDEDRGNVRATLERLAAEESGGGARRGWLRLAAAAVIVAAAFFSWRQLRPPGSGTPGDPSPPQYLGVGDLALDEPRGEAARWSVFRWRAELPPNGYYELRVYDATPEGDGERLLKIRPRTETWTPTDEELELLPDRIRWELDVYRADGRTVVSDEATAWLAE